ncbi:MAG: SAM-dependent methyltransferase [Nocardiopsaceae bacterium]|nr:SAM-dependent methyltransferase [Nocardiopsaceae bacterium]
MTDEEWLRPAAHSVPRPRIDASAPNVARVRNYLTGGRDNFDVDRRVARQLVKASPVMEHVGYACRAFLGRVTRYLAGEAGIRQFIDVGTGIPAPGGVHDVAQSAAPSSRVVCVDNDPVVLSHARALLRPAPEGATSYVDASVREPGKITERAREILDFGQPVAIVLNRLLQFVGHDSEVRAILAAMLGEACPGSYLVVVHPASDLDQSLDEAARRWNKVSTAHVVLRGREEITAWFDGLDLVDPGVVPVTEWRPGPPDATHVTPVPVYGAVARKPGEVPAALLRDAANTLIKIRCCPP